jgi:hypothetical protein
VFIETRAWISDYGYDQTLHAFDKSAGKLGVDQIDLFILHQALLGQFDLTREAYRALETLLADGRVRAPWKRTRQRWRGLPQQPKPLRHMRTFLITPWVSSSILWLLALIRAVVS